MKILWSGKKVGLYYLLITIGSLIQHKLPEFSWFAIPAIAVIFGLEKQT